MSGYNDREETDDLGVDPPFNVNKTYEVFNKSSVSVTQWSKEEALVVRFHELNLPLDLFPACMEELEAGGMLMIWPLKAEEKLGYAIHKH